MSSSPVNSPNIPMYSHLSDQTIFFKSSKLDSQVHARVSHDKRRIWPEHERKAAFQQRGAYFSRPVYPSPAALMKIARWRAPTADTRAHPQHWNGLARREKSVIFPPTWPRCTRWRWLLPWNFCRCTYSSSTALRLYNGESCNCVLECGGKPMAWRGYLSSSCQAAEVHWNPSCVKKYWKILRSRDASEAFPIFGVLMTIFWLFFICIELSDVIWISSRIIFINRR